jgi:hypothetical protein
LNYQTGHIGANKVIELSTIRKDHNTDNVTVPLAPGFQSTNLNVGSQSIYMSQTYQNVSKYPGHLSVEVRDEQFTFIKGLTDKLNIFSFLDAPNKKVEIAPGRVFNDFLQITCRSQFPHSR